MLYRRCSLAFLFLFHIVVIFVNRSGIGAVHVFVQSALVYKSAMFQRLDGSDIIGGNVSTDDLYIQFLSAVYFIAYRFRRVEQLPGQGGVA